MTSFRAAHERPRLAAEAHGSWREVLGCAVGDTAEGLSKPEIMRCLKRYVARELFPLIQAITASSPLVEGDATGSQIAA